MTKENYSSKRIARNSIMLYIRTGVMMVITFYTTRVLLLQLGVEDYGVYDVLMGVVTLFAFANSSMSIATQRFVSNALGQGGEDKVKETFSANVYIYCLMVVICFILFETVGVWYVYNYINVPPDRISVSKIVYQLVILQFIFMTFRIPYSSAIIAYERMDFYAYVSILEAVLSLGLVFVLSVVEFDKLVLYVLLLVALRIIVLCFYIIYCKQYISSCRLIGIKHIPKETFSDILSFSGWNIFGAFSTTVNYYGVNLVVNYFCGVVINATIGISNQLTMGLYNLVVNLQTAFNPQVYKLYAANEFDSFRLLIFRNSRFCFFLFAILLIPFYICINDILQLWLGRIPVYSVEICRCMLFFLAIESLSYPLYVAIQADGNIKSYQRTISLLYLLFVLLSYFLFLIGFNIIAIFVSRIFLNVVVTIYRLIYLRRIMSFGIKKYIFQICIKCMLVLFLAFILPYVLYKVMTEGVVRMLVVTISSLLITSLTVFYVGMTNSERNAIKNFVQKIIR